MAIIWPINSRAILLWQRVIYCLSFLKIGYFPGLLWIFWLIWLRFIETYWICCVMNRYCRVQLITCCTSNVVIHSNEIFSIQILTSIDGFGSLGPSPKLPKCVLNATDSDSHVHSYSNKTLFNSNFKNTLKSKNTFPSFISDKPFTAPNALTSFTAWKKHPHEILFYSTSQLFDVIHRKYVKDTSWKEKKSKKDGSWGEHHLWIELH